LTTAERKLNNTSQKLSLTYSDKRCRRRIGKILKERKEVPQRKMTSLSARGVLGKRG